MSWYDAVAAAELVAGPAGYEAERFGVSVDRIAVSASSGAPLASVLAAVSASDADVVILRYPARETGWFASLAVASSRTAVLADSLCYWTLPVGSGRRPPRLPGYRASMETSLDSALVDSVVADVFGGYGNHYAANPLFSSALALAGYQEWARRSIAVNGAVTVRGPDDRVVGLATVEQGAVTEIQLAGVVPAEQGRARYPHLLAAVEDIAAADRLVISTQGHNTGVQRAWARYGFEPVHTLLTVHLVRSELFMPSRATVGTA